MINGEVQLFEFPNEMAERSATTAGTKRASPAVKCDPLGQVAASRNAHKASDGAEYPEGDVHQKDQAPTASGEQETTDGRTEGQPECLGCTLDADGFASGPVGNRQHNDGHAVGLEHGGPQALEDPKSIERHQGRGEPTQGRADREDDEAIHIEQLATDHVGETAHGGDTGHQDEQIAQSDPGDGSHACAERRLQGREGDRDDAGVQLPHERADAHGGNGQPVGVRTIPDCCRAPGLDQQTVPPVASDRGRPDLHTQRVRRGFTRSRIQISARNDKIFK